MQRKAKCTTVSLWDDSEGHQWGELSPVNSSSNALIRYPERERKYPDVIHKEKDQKIKNEKVLGETWNWANGRDLMTSSLVW